MCCRRYSPADEVIEQVARPQGQEIFNRVQAQMQGRLIGPQSAAIFEFAESVH